MYVNDWNRMVGL